MILAFFEDPGYESLWPVTASMPLYMLKPGPLRLYEAWSRLLGLKRCVLFCRRDLEGMLRWVARSVEEKDVLVNPDEVDEELLAVNSSYLPLPEAVELAKQLRDMEGNAIAHVGGRPVLIRATRSVASSLVSALKGVLEVELLFSVAASFEEVPAPQRPEIVGMDRLCENVEELLAIALKASGRKGVEISSEAEVMENVVIREPAYVGPGVVVEPYTVIEGASVEGPAKVSGVIRGSVIHAYTELLSSRVENCILAGCNVVGSFSSISRGGAMGFAAKLLPSSALLEHAAVGVASRVAGVFKGKLMDGRSYEYGVTREVEFEEAVKGLRRHLLSFGRLPSDHELRLLERACKRRER